MLTSFIFSFLSPHYSRNPTMSYAFSFFNSIHLEVCGKATQFRQGMDATLAAPHVLIV